MRRPKTRVLPVLISYGDEVYRPAGYRIPAHQEQYIGKDGHVKTCKAALPPEGERLIVRLYDGQNDFGGPQK